MSNTDFIAVDFETATNSRMACQIGIVVVRNGNITERISKLIQPPFNEYDSNTIRVHHITPDNTKNSDTFDKIWDQISPYFINNTIVAHNAQFDEDVLYKNLAYYGILPLGIEPFKCTCNIFGRMGLHDLCECFGMNTSGHHDALFDAECCANFYLKYLNGEDPDALLIPKKKKSLIEKQADRLSGDILVKDLSNADPNNPFYDRKVVITGEFDIERKELGKILKSMGADIDTGITKKTNYVLIGEYPGPKKIEKLDKLIHDGYNIRRLYFTDINAILEGDWEGYHAEKAVRKDLDFTIDHYNSHNIVFKDLRNIIASKELYYGKGFAGNFDLFNQITGNLGAFGDNDIYPETNICVLSNSTIAQLAEGIKDDTIEYIQNFYNSNKAITFDFQFISEQEILRYCKERCEKYEDEITAELYNRYLDSIV
ncbi:hypothetical protein BOVA604_1325 [Bacteroides ovatus]|jgi:DNA polymerase-3 subunit epsilon|uniref:exonuclease domain-containing protein n=1 Tax=Bacteroides TaxID=816 RepID=UPI000E99E6E8|nr:MULTISPECIES: exonuclease domain-containing protein [Bacteroides]MCS3178463.1 exonuclease domain-containing protein [Candidatus Bacteroides intestinigallinarum]RGN54575.1 hypothetical protein DXB58_23985 [Bacteroides sp. OM05-10AA]RGQ69131.1 hypothetical protein DWY87_00110 [Bacteroides sp. AF27-33]CAG9892034.1 hypothetical protein BOVA604_1325 [Bacteroides ovatus]